jgi:acetate kinase
MGLTPSGGVMMATRSGDLDPGLLVYLIREHGLDAAGLEAMIDRQAGMAGVSGLSGDLRQLREARDNADARLAVEMFSYSVRKQIAAMAAALEGLDLLVFTGGIGEHDAQTRREVCVGLSWLGLRSATTQD